MLNLAPDSRSKVSKSFFLKKTPLSKCPYLTLAVTLFNCITSSRRVVTCWKDGGDEKREKCSALIYSQKTKPRSSDFAIMAERIRSSAAPARCSHLAVLFFFVLRASKKRKEKKRKEQRRWSAVCEGLRRSKKRSGERRRDEGTCVCEWVSVRSPSRRRIPCSFISHQA